MRDQIVSHKKGGAYFNGGVMKVLKDLVANNKKVFNISLLLSFCLVAIAGIVEIDEFHEVVGYVFLALAVVHVSIYWKSIKGLIRL